MRRVLWSTASQVISRGLTVLLGLITIGVLTRSLGTAGYGQYATIFAVLGFVGTLVDLGMYLVITRRIGAGEDPSRVVSAVLGLRLVSFVGIVIVVALADLVLPYDSIVKAGILLGTISVLGITLNQALGGLFQAKQRMDQFVVGDVLGRAVTLGLLIWFLAVGWGLLGAVWAVIFGYAGNLAVTYWFAKRYAKIRFSFERGLWEEIIREAIPVGILIIFGIIYLRIDLVIISLFRSASDVGIYGVAEKVAEILATAPLIIMAAMLPMLSRAVAYGDTAKLRVAAHQIFQAMVLLGLGLAVGLAFVSNEAARLIGGADFAASGLPLAIVGVAAGLGFFTAFFSHLMIAYGKQRQLAFATGAVALLNIILNLLLVPRLGYLASAWITVLSEAMIVIWYAAVTRRATGYYPVARNVERVGLALLGMAVVLWLTGSLEVLLRIVLAAAVYVGLVLALKAFQFEDAKALLERQPE